MLAGLRILRVLGVAFLVLIVASLTTRSAIVAQATGRATWTPVLANKWTFAVAFADPRNGVTVGSGGEILRTTDGGVTWTPQVSGTTERLEGVAFADSRTGVAVGTHGTILHTIDAGRTWLPVMSGTDKRLTAIAFADARTGIALEWQGGRVLRTPDGGASWTEQSIGTERDLERLAFADAHTAVALGWSTVLRTSDGGTQWIEVQTGAKGFLEAIAFADGRTGIAVGEHGALIRTTDGGASWTTQASGTGENLNAIAFADSHAGVVVGEHGTILRTEDGGAHWTPQSSGTTQRLHGIVFPDASTGIALGAESILRSTSAGVGGPNVPVTAREQLQRLTAMLQEDSSTRETLREEIIHLAQAIEPKPAIPGEVDALVGKAKYIFSTAQTEADFIDAAKAFQSASVLAPWVADYYFNIGVAMEKGRHPRAAIINFKLYLAAAPAAPDAREVRERIGGLQFLIDKQAQERAAHETKYGGRHADGQSFTLDDLYRYGAVVKDLRFDASGGVVRTISLKVLTRKESGALVSYLGLWDFTDPADLFGQVFRLDWRGTETFYLEDQPARGLKDYLTLTVTPSLNGDADVTVVPAANTSVSIQTTIGELLRERARQAVYAGAQIRIAAQEFYVVAGGGAKGTLLYFPVELKNQLDQRDARNLVPTLVAQVTHVVNGRTEQYENSDLGIINGVHYHLEWNGSQFAPVVGIGEVH